VTPPHGAIQPTVEPTIIAPRQHVARHAAQPNVLQHHHGRSVHGEHTHRRPPRSIGTVDAYVADAVSWRDAGDSNRADADRQKEGVRIVREGARHDLQAAVEQRWMDAVIHGIGQTRVGQHDLAQALIAVFGRSAPQRSHALESRAERHAARGEVCVERVDGHRLAAKFTGARQGVRRLDGDPRTATQARGDMPGPALRGAVDCTGVLGRAGDRDAERRFAVRRFHHGLHESTTALRHQHRIAEGDVLDHPGRSRRARAMACACARARACARFCAQRVGRCREQQFEIRGGGQHDATLRHVIAHETRMIGGEVRLINAAGDSHREFLSQQRMSARRRARRRLVWGRCARGCAKPVTFALEGIRGQIDDAAARGERGRRDARSLEEQRRDGFLEVRPIGLSAPQARNERGGVEQAARLREGQQHRMRTDLDAHIRRGGGERPYAVGEAHRLAQMPAPVLRPDERRRVGRGAREIRNQAQPRSRKGHLACRCLEGIQHRLDQVRMKGVRHRQRHAPHAARSERGRRRSHRCVRPRDDGLRGSVQRGDAELGTEQAGQRFRRTRHRRHRAAGRQ
jgi:hypothetical protein